MPTLPGFFAAARLFYNQLLEEIHSDQIALDEKKELVRLLKKRFDREAIALKQVPPAPGMPLAMAATPAAAVRVAEGSFVQIVEGVLPSLGDREFVVGDVAEVLRAKGVVMPEKPNPKITTVLTRLQSTGVLARTFTGAGNVPNRFRLVSAIKAGDSEEESLA